MRLRVNVVKLLVFFLFFFFFLDNKWIKREQDSLSKVKEKIVRLMKAIYGTQMSKKSCFEGEFLNGKKDKLQNYVKIIEFLV